MNDPFAVRLDYLEFLEYPWDPEPKNPIPREEWKKMHEEAYRKWIESLQEEEEFAYTNIGEETNESM